MRRWLLVLGIVAVGGGLLTMIDPGTIQIGIAEGILLGTAALALLAVAHAIKTASDADRLEHAIPAVEAPDQVAAPGDDVDARLARALPPRKYIRDRRVLRRQAHTLATHALVTFGGYGPEEATELLDTGEWTEDIQAAVFLGAPHDERGLAERARERLRSDHRFERHFRHTIDAIAEYVPGEYAPPQDVGGGWFRPTLGAPGRGVSDRPAGTPVTGHWRGISVLALAGIGVGLATEISVVLLIGAVGIGYVAYARLGGPPEPDLAVERVLTPTDPRPDETLEVELTITNTGDRLLPDLRIIDGVPAALRVTGGHARTSVALRAGESVTISYELTARAGRHRWEPVVVIARSLNGSYEHTMTLSEASTVTSVPLPQPIQGSIPLRATGQIAVGELRTDRAGEGVEFQSVRDYRAGDRRTRIDWRRYARTNDLTTVEFREEHATTVLVAVDARASAYLAPDAETPHAVQRAVGAADRLISTLLGAGHRVGVTTLAPDPLWLPPSAERAMKHRAREELASHPSVSQTPPEEDFRPFSWVEWFRSQMLGEAQVVLISPLCDEVIVEAIVRIEARGYPVTVISPDPTATDTSGRRLVALERRVRLGRLRQRGVTVVDWPADESIDASLIRLSGGEWSS